MESLSSILCFTGVLLFLMGLLTGFAIPFFRSARIGLIGAFNGRAERHVPDRIRPDVAETGAVARVEQFYRSCGVDFALCDLHCVGVGRGFRGRA